MFDDSHDSATDTPVVDQLDRPQRRIYEYVREHGPIARPSLQADLYPYDRRTFESALETLVQNGYLHIDEFVVSIALTVAVLAPSYTVTVPGFDKPVTYRPATEKDIYEILDIIENTNSDVCTECVSETVASRRGDGSHKTPRGERDGNAVFVAEHDGTVRGWAYVAGEPSDGEAELDGGVADGVRRNGLGSRFHRYVVDWTRTRGYDRVSYVVATADAETFQFLRARGWAVDGVISGADGTAGDELRLVLELDDGQ